MGFLKKLDLFRSVNREQKEGTILGAVLTFVSLVLVAIFYSKELKEYNQEKLTTKLYLLSLTNTLIQVEFDVIIYNIKCEHLVVVEEHKYEDMTLEKLDYEEKGCEVKGIYYMQPMDNQFSIKPDFSSSIMDLMQGASEDGKKNRIDMSHKIVKLQFGRSVSRLTALSENYPDLVKINPLDGYEYHAEQDGDGHSVFLYELNIVGAKVNGKQEMLYHFNKNTINSFQIQPSITLIHDFSPIGVAYDERRGKNFLEFLTYLFAIMGGILAIIKFLNNMVLLCTSGRKPITVETVMEMSS